MKERVIIGTWPLSGDYGNIKPAEVERVLEYCYIIGFTEYDTAPSYGDGFAEFCLGKVFRDREVKINTKVGNLPFNGKDFRLETLQKSFEQSLRRLNRETVNILFLHNPRNIQDWVPILKWFQKLKISERIKYSGISLAKNYKYDPEILNAFDYVQEDYNLLNLDFAKLKIKAKKIGRSPLANGVLSGRVDKYTKFNDDDHRSKWLKEARLQELIKETDKVIRVIRQYKLSLPEAAQRFVLEDSRMNKVIFGVKSYEHVRDLLLNCGRGPLSPEFVSDIRRIEHEARF